MHVLLVRDRRPMRPRGRTIRLRVVSGPTEPPAGLHTTVSAFAWRGRRGGGTMYRQREQLQDALTSTWRVVTRHIAVTYTLGPPAP